MAAGTRRAARARADGARAWAAPTRSSASTMAAGSPCASASTGWSTTASFHEVGAIAGKADYDDGNDLTKLMPSNCVMGRAQIDGRPVVVVGDDFTVRGGSADATIREKPLHGRADGARSARCRSSASSRARAAAARSRRSRPPAAPTCRAASARQWATTCTANLGQVPVVALGLGSVAGLGAARLAASHYSVMTKETSAMFVAGPPVVNALGQHSSTSRNSAAGRSRRRAGAVDHAVDTRGGGVRSARAASSPTCRPRSTSVPPRGPQTDDPERREEILFDGDPARPRKVYKMRPIIEAVVDQGCFFEMGRMFGRSIDHRPRAPRRAAGRGDGERPVSSTAARWTADACQKIVRFVDLAETFHLPVVYLCDCPGFLIGLEAEKSGDDPPGRARDGGDQPVRACRGARSSCATSFGVAGAVHQPAGRFRSAMPGCRRAGARCRWRAASRPPTAPRSTPPPTARPRSPRSRTRLQQAALAVPHRRDVLGRGDHRPARHPQAAVRVRRPGRSGARLGPFQLLDAAVIQSCWVDSMLEFLKIGCALAPPAIALQVRKAARRIERTRLGVVLTRQDEAV